MIVEEDSGVVVKMIVEEDSGVEVLKRLLRKASASKN